MVDALRREIGIYQGEGFYVRGLRESDLSGRYPDWFDDPEVTRYNSHGLFPNTPERMRAYLTDIGSAESRTLVWAVVAKDRGLHIGNVTLDQIHWVYRTAELSLVFGEREYWGRGLATQACRLLVRHGFERLNLERVYCQTIEGNVGMVRVAEKLGMQQEGRRRKAVFANGAYADMLEFGVLREEFLANDQGYKR